VDYPTSVVSMDTGVTSICAGDAHTCAVKGGAAYCWGSNQFGAVGNNQTVDSPVAAQVFGLSSGVVKVSCGIYHTCALLATGTISCWGDNSYGQCGDGVAGTNVYRVPVPVVNITNGNVVDVLAGRSISCGVIDNGGQEFETWCWGSNLYGQLGNGATALQQRIPAKMNPGLAGPVRDLASGVDFVCGIDGSGQTQCTGLNDIGQLADGTTTTTSTLVPVVGLSPGGSSKIASSLSDKPRTCVVMESGALQCWGDYTRCCLGNGTASITVMVPTLLPGPQNHKDVSLGSNHACTIRGDNDEVWCWGVNGNRQLGVGSTESTVLEPMPVVFPNGN